MNNHTKTMKRAVHKQFSLQRQTRRAHDTVQTLRAMLKRTENERMIAVLQHKLECAEQRLRQLRA